MVSDEQCSEETVTGAVAAFSVTAVLWIPPFQLAVTFAT
jgi:hypothetical protein